MPLKGAGAAGSVAGAVLLGLFLMRSSNPGPAGAAPQAQASAVRAMRTQPGSGQSQPPQAKQLPEDGPWQASRDHFAAVSGACASLQDANGRWCIPAGETVQGMIAIVPDPVNTHMALVFDRSIEAIQLAAESENYVVDRYWLPWDATAQPVWNDYESYQHLLQDQEEKEKQPGLLLFRWSGDANSDTPRVLYVFVVSDTATAGVNGLQFGRAVEYMRQVCGTESGCPYRGPVRIMGPTFSGSLASLVQLTGSGNFAAYSGTVSSQDAVDHQHLGQNSGHLTLRTFVNYSETAITRFLTLLTSTREIQCDSRRAPQVAVLSETATAYGATRSITYEKTANLADTCVASFSYPMEISDVRNAAQASLAASQAASGTGITSPYLSFSLTDREPNRNDQPPAFSNPQGPLSKEAVLMKLAGELERNHYKYIGVTGTNVLDVLYLVSFVHNTCPDARLFIVNSDLLFDRNLDNAPYIGTLSVTTYPQVARNLDWTTQYANTPRLPFADQYEEGQYNAFLATLQEMLPGKNLPPAYEMSEPFNPGEKTLPLWLTVAGAGGYWPVRLLHSAEDGGWNKPELKREDFSPAWEITLTLLGLLAAFHIYLLLAVSPASRRFRDFSLLAETPAQRMFFIHLASAALALGLAMMLFPVWTFRWRGGPYIAFMSVLAAILVLALPATCWWLHAHRRLYWNWACATGEKEGPPTWDSIYPALLVWLGLFAALGTLWFLLFRDDATHYGFFFAYRSLYLATGVSPYTPMIPLLATIYCWCILEVWRLRFHSGLRPKLEPGPLPARSSAEGSIIDAVSRFLLGRRYVTVFVVIFVFWLALFDPVHPFELFEDPPFAWVYAALFCLGVAMMLSSGLRLWEIWTHLRTLLQELERKPLRRAFSRLKGLGWSSIWRHGGEEADWLNMARSIEAMRLICNGTHSGETGYPCASGSAQDSAESIDLHEEIKTIADKGLGIRQSVDAVRANPAILTFLRCVHEYNDWKKSDETQKAVKKEGCLIRFLCNIEGQFAAIQEVFATALQRVMGTLEKEWRERCPELEEDDGGTDEKTQVIMCQPEEPSKEERRRQQLEQFAALRYVAFIRAVLSQMRHLIIFLALSFSLLMISLNVYSFEPHQTLLWSFTVIFCLVGLMIVTVLTQVHKDHILSRVTGTKGNELGFQFYLRIASFGAVPALTFLATHFPAIGHYVVSFLQPSLQSIK